MTGFCEQSGNCEAGVGVGGGRNIPEGCSLDEVCPGVHIQRSDGLCVGVWGRSALQGYSRKSDA